MRSISELLGRLDHVVSTEFIPSITGGIAPLACLYQQNSGEQRLGISIFSDITKSEYENSHSLTDPLQTKGERRYEKNSKLENIKKKITQF